MLTLHQLDCIHSPALHLCSTLLAVLTPLPLGGDIPAGHGDTCLYPQLLERLTWKDLDVYQRGHPNGTPSQERRDIVFNQLYLLFPSVLNSNSLDNYANAMHPRSDQRVMGRRKIGVGLGRRFDSKIKTEQKSQQPKKILKIIFDNSLNAPLMKFTCFGPYC